LGSRILPVPDFSEPDWQFIEHWGGSWLADLVLVGFGFQIYVKKGWNHWFLHDFLDPDYFWVPDLP
jgi:hypothetical protein